MPQTGLLCSITATDLTVVNPACQGGCNTVNQTVCQHIRNSTDVTCQITYCYAIPLFNGSALTPTLVIVGDIAFSVAAGTMAYVTLTGNCSGPVYATHQVAQFMQNNLPDSTNPIEPDPRPVPSIVHYYPADYGAISYQNPARELARQGYVAFLNYNAAGNTIYDPPDIQPYVFGNFSKLVFTPSRCPDAELGAIPYTWTTPITVEMMVRAAATFAGLNVTNSQCDPANWLSTCNTLLGGNQLCSFFPSYYSYASLRDFTILPSMWRDLITFSSTYAKEYDKCGVPRGCMGVGP